VALSVQNVTKNDIVFREATAADLAGIMQVRVSVVENALSREQLELRGITNASIAASFLADSKGWIAEQGEQIVAFSIADRKTHSIFALFVLPGFEGHGLGSRLLDLALCWLWENGAERVWLTTDPQARAARFYERRGWVCTFTDPGRDSRYECLRPAER
jgi:GNAT superfamily N-acetyltransferase